MGLSKKDRMIFRAKFALLKWMPILAKNTILRKPSEKEERRRR
jgi:hypothetical protein